MVSTSYSNLLDLSSNSGGGHNNKGLSAVSRSLSKASLPAPPEVFPSNGEGDCGNNMGSPNPHTLPSSPKVLRKKTIIVADRLPLRAEKKDGSWDFALDESSLLPQIRDGLPKDTQVLYVGCLNAAHIEPSQQDSISASLLDKFDCLPVFVDPDLRRKYFDGFCKHHLWPLFHYMLPITSEHGSRFDRALWQAYVAVNLNFAERVMEVINSEDDFVWVHDYQLMALPTFLRKRYHKVKMGFFLHIPFPSSEIYRTLPVREEILRGLLNADLIGFHTFDYARHFLSCCSRMLGLHFKTQRGYIGLDYFGRTVGIKILPVGIHMGRITRSLATEKARAKIEELKEDFKEKTVILGVDNLDIFQGIGLKLLAMEKLLENHPQWRGKLVMVQVAKPAAAETRKDEVLRGLKEEIRETAKRVNEAYGGEGYRPVVLKDDDDEQMEFDERMAYYKMADCCVVTAVRDGLNLIPYEYTVCRQQQEEDLVEGNKTSSSNSAAALHHHHHQKSCSSSTSTSMLVVSEFIGCSPSLSGAIRVNPWNIDCVVEAILSALTISIPEKQMRHHKHYKYVSSHDVGFWVRSFVGDLERTCRDHAQQRCWGIGFGFGFRIVALDPSFRKLSVEYITSAYKRARNRVILLDYDGTMVPSNAIDKTPTPRILSVLNDLCDDPNNLVFIVSGRSRQVLQDWFGSCRNLGLSAEHGYFNRWSQEQPWESSSSSSSASHTSDFSWMEIVEPVLKRYTESTDGSYIEAKESALVWHYQDADPDFGSWQAKELLHHLESILAHKPVVVKSGHLIVEVKPQGVSKGIIAKELIFSMVEKGKPPEFVLCIGDDRSDEEMFENIATAMEDFPQTPLAEAFACTVGQKPSKAKYYVDDPTEVINMLSGLTEPYDEGGQQCYTSGAAMHRNLFFSTEKLC